MALRHRRLQQPQPVRGPAPGLVYAIITKVGLVTVAAAAELLEHHLHIVVAPKEVRQKVLRRGIVAPAGVEHP